MRLRTVLILVAVVVLVGVGSLGFALLRHGFSAREQPSRLEEFLARQARKIATPADAKELDNPYSLASERLPSVQAHWVDHCALCHALNGSGDTGLGRNLYPPAPDMREPSTQSLRDGELYYIIQNGVRFTGMPAWGGEHTQQETWELVAFIRRLPSLSAEELQQMEALAAGTAGPSHTHGPGAKPHAH